MRRVPDVVGMDPAAARTYAAMDLEASHAAFLDFLIGHRCDRGELLDIGAGTGDIAIRLAQARPEASLTAIDSSEAMLNVARLKVAQAGLSRRIRLMSADAQDLPFAEHQFDGVFSNGVLHFSPAPIVFLREAARVRKPGGALVVRDLARPASRQQVEAIVGQLVQPGEDDQRRLLTRALAAAYTVDEVRGLLERAGLTEAEVAMTTDRHLSVWIDPQ